MLSIATAARAQDAPASVTSDTQFAPTMNSPAHAAAQPASAPAGDVAANYPQASAPDSNAYLAPVYLPPQPIYTLPLRRRHVTRVQDYAGGPVPMGMHIETRRSHALVGSGLAVLGLSYIGSMLSAAVCAGTLSCTSGLGWLLLPVAGPIIAMGFPQSTEGRVALTADGVAQVAGLAVLVLALLDTHHVLVEDLYAASSGTHRSVRFTVAPLAIDHGGGASITLSHF